MALPAFVAASTGSTDTTGAWTHTGMAPGAAGRIIILHVLEDGALGGVGVTSVTNMEQLNGADGNMDQIGGAFPMGHGDVAAALHYLWIGRSLSTSAPVVTGTNTGGDDVYIRMYEFSGASVGTTLATVIENTVEKGTRADVATPTYFDVRGDGGTPGERYAERFMLDENQTITEVGVTLAKTGTPTDNLLIEIQTDSAGVPSDTVVGTGATQACSGLTTSPVDYTLSLSASLTGGVPYHLVFRRSGARDLSNFPRIVNSNEFPNDLGGVNTAESRGSGTWNDIGNHSNYVLVKTTGLYNWKCRRLEGGLDDYYDAAVKTTGTDRLALQFLAVNDDIAVAAFAGANLTGGTWVEPVAEYSTSSGTDGLISINTADMAAAGLIFGGSFGGSTAVSGGVIGFALLPDTGAPPADILPRHGFVNHANPGIL